MVRAVLGDRFFPFVGRYYRRLFVDLEKVADAMGPFLGNVHVLDIGAGDGEIENIILRRNPHLTATLIDLSPRPGGWLSPDVRQRVEIFSRTSVAAYQRLGRRLPDVVILCDVVHHVPPDERRVLFEEIRRLLQGQPARLIIKDLEPGSLRSFFCYAADRYITGDPNVSQISRSDLRQLVSSVFREADCADTALFEVNPPNYCLVFSI
jgi:2-polyprenyl-6-hydroxyphenyl methylase/3-demethylubiquinone-9 3-methyltransferase